MISGHGLYSAAKLNLCVCQQVFIGFHSELMSAPSLEPAASNNAGPAAQGMNPALDAALPPPIPPAFFERQSWSRCAVHALNNLLQRPAFIAADLDRICYELSPTKFINPHKSMFGVVSEYKPELAEIG
jgi:hypothetical protein